MVNDMMNYFREDDEMVNRFVNHAFKQNSSISDFREFVNALHNAFGTPNGSNARGNINEEEEIYLFGSEECKRQISFNISDEKFKEIYGKLEEGNLRVFRETPIGKKAKKPPLIADFSKEKKHKVNRHKRAGGIVSGYEKTYQRWSKSQERFIKKRKDRGISPKKIIYDYNSTFKDRTKSSIKTKIYRI